MGTLQGAEGWPVPSCRHSARSLQQPCSLPNTKWQPLPGFGAAPGSGAWAAASRGGLQHPLHPRTPSLAGTCLGADPTGGPSRGCPHPYSHGCPAEPRSGSDRVDAACEEGDKKQGWQLLVPSAELESQRAKQIVSGDKNVLLKAGRYFCCRYCYDLVTQHWDLQHYKAAQGYK